MQLVQISKRTGPRQWALHAARVLCLLAIAVGLFGAQQKRNQQAAQQPWESVDPQLFATAFQSFAEPGPVSDDGRRLVLAADASELGYVLQTSPEGDGHMGFSGPTNLLLAFHPDDTLKTVQVIRSKDTRDHLALIKRTPEFFDQYTGLSPQEITALTQIDTVSGATLTCHAIHGAIVARLSVPGARKNSPSRFPAQLTLEQARQLFPNAVAVQRSEEGLIWWNVQAEGGGQLGSMLQTSPVSDSIVGFQGPTQAYLGFDTSNVILGSVVAESFDNEPYVTYVREDDYFQSLFKGRSLDELSASFEDVEGVSGATMTSQAVAAALANATRSLLEHRARTSSESAPASTPSSWSGADLGTGIMILGALILAFVRLPSRRPLRLAYQFTAIVFLGIVTGNMVSMAMFAGWAQNGIPWERAMGLVLLAGLAFLPPIMTGHNVYCDHVCPHGAAQQLLKGRLPWKFRLGRGYRWALKLVPSILLGWCFVVATCNLSFSLVDIEPFDAWLIRATGWASLSVALVGLASSLLWPMSYCRYGCPTGRLLNYLRIHPGRQRWTRADWLVVAMAIASIGCGWL